MKNTKPLLLTFGAAVFLFSACSSAGNSDIEAPTGNVVPEQKVGDTTKTGVVSQVGGMYFIKEGAKDPAEIKSNTVDIAPFIGQTVTVTGQYSGDTLYIKEIK